MLAARSVVHQAAFGVPRCRRLPPPAITICAASAALPSATQIRRAPPCSTAAPGAHPPVPRSPHCRLLSPLLSGCFSAAGNGPFPEGFCARCCRGRWAGQGAGHPRRCVLPARLLVAGGAVAPPRACRGLSDLSFFFFFIIAAAPGAKEENVGVKNDSLAFRLLPGLLLPRLVGAPRGGGEGGKGGAGGRWGESAPRPLPLPGLPSAAVSPPEGSAGGSRAGGAHAAGEAGG